MSGNSRGPDRAELVISLTMKTPVTLGKKRAERTWGQSGPASSAASFIDLSLFVYRINGRTEKTVKLHLRPKLRDSARLPRSHAETAGAKCSIVQ